MLYEGEQVVIDLVSEGFFVSDLKFKNVGLVLKVDGVCPTQILIGSCEYTGRSRKKCADNIGALFTYQVGFIPGGRTL